MPHLYDCQCQCQCDWEKSLSFFLLLLLHRHFFVQSVVKANGSLAFASGEDNGSNRSFRYKKKPSSIPFIKPRTDKHPNRLPHGCPHKACTHDHRNGQFSGAVCHGMYCDGSTPRWEGALVLQLLTPGILMEDITSQCRTLVLASGSLAPISSLCAELNLHPSTTTTTTTSGSTPRSSNNSPMKPMPQLQLKGRLQVLPPPLEANHVINLKNQLRAISVGYFPDDTTLTVNYNQYKHASSFFPKLGNALATIVEAIPSGGVLIFVPSYSFLKKCIQCWNPDGAFGGGGFRGGGGGGYSHRFSQFSQFSQNDTNNNNNGDNTWNRFLQSKGKVIIEPTGSQADFEKAKQSYNQAIETHKKCLLLAVFRGKMSEGISFNDDYARAVICVGLPLPMAYDKAISAKRAYNDEQRKLRHRTDLLPGQEWYMQQAYRAIAKALGRCIRHAADYGTVMVLLLWMVVYVELIIIYLNGCDIMYGISQNRQVDHL